MAETDLLPTQPTTHTCTSHWRQWFMCEDYSLTRSQLQDFYELKDQSNILFEGQNERWDLVKDLYSLYFEEAPKMEGKEWMQLGFQGKHPETDFRGGGVLSLKLIIRFVRNNKNLVKTMEKDKGNFFFAITAINIAFFMKKYFHLADYLMPQRDQNQYCNRRALKNFCSILISERNTYQQIHQLFLKHFYERMWLPAQQKNPQTLLQFNALFQELVKDIKETFQSHNLRDFHDFINVWGEISFRRN